MDAIRPFGLPVVVVGFVIAVIAWASGNPVSNTKTPTVIPDDLADVVARVDNQLEQRWKNAVLHKNSKKKNPIPSPVTPAEPADERQVLRRLSLALLGTVPSLEEIRLFDADAEPHRLTRWTLRYLNDSRFPDYFAERLARGFVSTEGGTFIIYRRDRFVDWLRDQLQKNIPYDKIVREMIASDGLWTGDPATNFMTAAYQDKKFNVNQITSRSVRAFLGQRIDCVQCHDAHSADGREHHADWKQHHFEGLAAFFGQTR